MVYVKMADSSVVKTARFVHFMVDFGKASGMLKFTVLPKCPSVLGMPFLRYFNPVINW